MTNQALRDLSGCNGLLVRDWIEDHKDVGNFLAPITPNSLDAHAAIALCFVCDSAIAFMDESVRWVFFCPEDYHKQFTSPARKEDGVDEYALNHNMRKILNHKLRKS
ncbi:hypothetical protein, partial [Nostoc sp. ChiVER01]|uniref:hypothetical protein n=1 Tax=Nostoc sp. ChiVER01 TaxID=3075382 RepID=UPI002AD477F7